MPPPRCSCTGARLGFGPATVSCDNVDDGMADCTDGSDEGGLNVQLCSCTESKNENHTPSLTGYLFDCPLRSGVGQFKCRMRGLVQDYTFLNCIDITAVYDNFPDCPDKSDERMSLYNPVQDCTEH